MESKEVPSMKGDTRQGDGAELRRLLAAASSAVSSRVNDQLWKVNHAYFSCSAFVRNPQTDAQRQPTQRLRTRSGVR